MIINTSSGSKSAPVIKAINYQYKKVTFNYLRFDKDFSSQGQKNRMKTEEFNYYKAYKIKNYILIPLFEKLKRRKLSGE